MANKLQVEAIKTGTVIDHIPAGQGIKILKQLHLVDLKEKITVGFNLPSKDLELKDLIKVENRLFTEAEANQLSLFAPSATINVIENYVVKSKFNMSIPEVVEAVFDCPNSNCISHTEPVNSYFTVKQKANDVQMKCKYCEKSFSKDIVAGI
ncbi:aspartate carbamoyltransferase regulatory subunit [Aestuariirhabdus litorea]|uniref:Aspartate carbamoyltransferase regulatory chain n=1 Tax=Aestuariirhabdus litorea TaxID=2528527 RepID=A0A3P3VMS0_9GAMM|nr:aspartate carbamoyltransferase regulatory subunit [Aestuariirhabdus litorea]RRJ83198.1 aspartate carbamoyltransferase regulatory subunit [Aestuariirhabdus litorea]RWW93355.1 aspartate carbamoyltransferase regulatory subunit [Endozoicomonadaceae bacterium GTF-13]